MNRYELKIQMLDQVLKYVADERMDSMAKEFPSKEKMESEIAFRTKFQKRMNSYFKKIKYKDYLLNFRKKLLKVGIITAACLVICLVIVSNVEALRVPILNFYNDISKQSTTINVQDAGGIYNSFGNQIKGMCLPNYIPQFYKVKSINKANKSYSVIYENADGSIINLRTMVEGSSTGVDSENADVLQIIVNGKQAQYFSKNGENIIIYEFDSNLFMVDDQYQKKT